MFFINTVPSNVSKEWKEVMTDFPLVSWDEFGRFIELPNYSDDIHQKLIDIADISEVTDFSFVYNESDEIGFVFFSDSKAVVDELYSQMREQL
jgi:hypothetical protein